MTYHLAVDIGASSGRHILGWIENGKLHTEEIYRFENNLLNKNGSLCWDIENLEHHVKAGIRECAKTGKIPETVAIDTWAVDYVLLDKNKRIISPVYCYRDSRTEKSIPEVEKIISPERLYERTGIQKQTFNTVYQLYSDKMSGRLEKAEYFMMIPEYLSYCLTGIIKNEYTNASTTSMVNSETFTWDDEIISALRLKKELFGKLSMPCTEIGGFTIEMKEYAGFDAKVVFCPSHDTASAVAACPLDENTMYISSGTWSLIGTESKTPYKSPEAMKAGFTNEGGIEKNFRFLKNYMGMWLFQNIRRNLGKSISYDEMMNLAQQSGAYRYIDVNNAAFVAPENMLDAIKEYLNCPDMPLGEVINSVYHSLAKSYADAVRELEGITGKTVENIRIVGGGCKDSYLNALTAEYTKKPVSAGPVEATAIGNLISQVMYKNPEYSLKKARSLVSTV